jgi:hypothetical protein
MSVDQPATTIDNLATSLADNVLSTVDDNENDSLKQVGTHSTDQCSSEITKVDHESHVKPLTNTDFHLIKWIEFNFEHLPILMQNINGPCPLIAIFNILLLRQQVKSS